MPDIVFFSTNRTKIAHFRYLGSKFNLGIRSFQEVNYYASYHEPRIDDRAELLRQSYISALEQWQRRQRKTDSDTSTFFFEDTSVRIEALSKTQEIPGVNVKFWMREMTFEKLDFALKAEGNCRRATVRSDIVMHLPKKWRDLLGTQDDFLWVFGEIHGNIVDEEQPINQNLVYPWLDDKSFNRWFVPDGAERPISALAIGDADKFDFRREAFDKIINPLKKLLFVDPRRHESLMQLELPRVPVFPSIFVICGPTCAGKTTTAGWMTDTYGIPHVEASDFMYKAFWERHGLRSSTRIGDFAEAALKTQPEIVASQIANHIIEKQLSSVVVTGFRALSEIEIFQREIPSEMKLELVYLDAQKELRFQRAVLRNRDHVTQEKFDSRNAQEERMGLMEIHTSTHSNYLENNETPAILFKNFRSKYRVAFKMQNSIETRFKFDTNLEPLILVTLLELNNSATWLTTTEIANALNIRFDEKKSKNNISRYFNQEYHPYFEVRLREANEKKTNTVEYRLSATGISEAKLLAKAHSNWLIRRRSPAKETTHQLTLHF